MPSRLVSMGDVARRAGVSRSTVSFVLNERYDIQIPDVTRRRVLAVAGELGYRPNQPARSLASQKSNLIGLITDITSSPFAGGILHGAQDAAWRSGRFLLIVSTEGDREKEAAAFEMLLERRVEGVIVATQARRQVHVPAAAAEVPTVLVHCFDESDQYAHVLPDEELGGYVATRRLIEDGHTRIGFINLSVTAAAAAGRDIGYRRALAESGLDIDEVLIRNGDATATDGYEHARSLLQLSPPPTALFCANDRMAMGAYDAVKELGLRIPEDIAVIGFDNQEVIAAFLRPALTTVALPFAEMGQIAVDLLIAGTPLVSPPEVACAIVERQSVSQHI